MSDIVLIALRLQTKLEDLKYNLLSNKPTNFAAQLQLFNEWSVRIEEIKL